MTKVTMNFLDAAEMITPTKPDAAQPKSNSRHAKMFDLLRHCEIDDGMGGTAPSTSRAPQDIDAPSAIAADQIAAVSARYLDADTADAMISRGVSSFNAPSWLDQSSERATERAAQFLTRQTS